MGSIIVVVVLACAAFYLLGGIEKVKTLFQPKEQAQSVTKEGVVLCLPHKDEGDTATLACAIGLKAGDGTYYGLSSSSNTELSEAAGTEKKVKITGGLQPQSDQTYKMEGIIAVNDFQFVE